MSSSSVTARQLSHNDISSLAQIFGATLQFYCKHRSPMEKDYFKELSTIMGLGFTTVLVDGNLLAMYEQRLQIFLRYRDFKLHPGSIGILSHAVAEMIDGTLFLFRFIKRPEYYETFITAVKEAVEHVRVCEAGKVEEAERLIQVLFQVCDQTLSPYC